MKKKLILVSSLFAFVVTGFAQQTSIGVTVGSGTGWMSNTGQDIVHKQSCNVGATLLYSTENHWGIGVDVKYSREGYKYNFHNPFLFGDKNMDTRVSSDFVRIPIRGIYFFNDNSHSVRPNISLGPNFGFLTGGKIRVEDDDHTIYSKTDVKDQYKPFDFGVQGTLGLSFKLAEALWLSTDIAYYQGLLKQNENGNNTMMNRNLVLNLGLRVGVGK